MADQEIQRCTSLAPDHPKLRCSLSAGHDGMHEAESGVHWINVHSGTWTKPAGATFVYRTKSGRQITDQDIDKWAAEAEEGSYGMDELRRQRVGDLFRAWKEGFEAGYDYVSESAPIVGPFPGVPTCVQVGGNRVVVNGEPAARVHATGWS